MTTRKNALKGSRNPEDEPVARRHVVLADDDVLLREGLASLLTHYGFQVMAEGLSNGGIAQKMWVTEGTVEKHVHSEPFSVSADGGV